jgi:hypothetical protein
MRYAHNILVGKFQGTRTPGRLTETWDYNIKMDLREIWCEAVDLIKNAQDRSQCLLHRPLKLVYTYKTIIMSNVLKVCDISFHRLKKFDMRTLRKPFGLKRIKTVANSRYYITKNFISYIHICIYIFCENSKL